MKLFLVRHGEAVAQNPRPLSSQGRLDVQRLARYLAELGAAPTEIRHSGKLRAEQTAELIAEELGKGLAPVQFDGMAPNDPVEPIARGVERLKEPSALMLVSHCPFLPCLAEYLLGSSASVASFPTAGVAILQRQKAGLWLLERQVSPREV